MLDIQIRVQWLSIGDLAISDCNVYSKFERAVQLTRIGVCFRVAEISL